ncbi:flagellar biosynthetic protein FliR [Paenibacillus sediminis]|uniref:Flagellar biosynthetic protein FliR n=1 Tax=Paenibacillus sediminis TaxID=664909 RepID=A0ABS4H1M1_9BACL|nr:flagellar biosynthetic protein FliR [Paenibacillus sediminis]MBP1936410.1 flagellar biosynthetic protein FliR [Paenibacillus sediminis]
MNMLLQSFPVFLLIFCRITSFFVVVPIFSTRGVPRSFKVGLAAVLALIVTMVYGSHQTVPTDLSYILVIFREIIIGLLLGFVAYLMFAVVQTSGAFEDLQIGLAMANVIDPMSGTSAPLFGNFKYMFAVLLFLIMNGHHYLLDAIMRSYEWIPLSNDLFKRMYDGNLADFLVETFSQSFLIALQVSAPIVVAMLLTDVGLAFLARTAPQFNIFSVGVPLKIIVGLFMMVLIVPSFSYVFEELFNKLFQALEGLLGTIGQRPQ